MTYFQFGNLSVPAIWIATIAALFIASVLNRLISGKKTSDWFWNGFFLYFLIWKLSYIVLHLDMFLDMPLSIVYFNGGKTGHIMGLAGLSIYLVMRAPKKFPSIYQEASRLFLLFFMCYQAGMNLLEGNHIEALGHLIILGGFLVFLHSLRKKGNVISNQMFIFIMLLVVLMMSFFQSILAWEPLTFIWLGLIIWFLCQKTDKEESHFE